jgi:hypothetical protein
VGSRLGGLLQFFGNEAQPTQSHSPGFNTLDRFDARHVHSATLVAPFAQNPRLTVSGWFVKGDPPNPMGYTHAKGSWPSHATNWREAEPLVFAHPASQILLSTGGPTRFISFVA